MKDLLIICPNLNGRLEKAFSSLERELRLSYTSLKSLEDLSKTSLSNARILVLLSLPETGINHEMYDILGYFRTHSDVLSGSLGAVIVDGPLETYTKQWGREIVFTMNSSGCAFMGKSLVEATGSLNNFQVTAKNMQVSLEEAYYHSAKDLIKSLLNFKRPQHDPAKKPSLLVIHASSHHTSNTYAFFEEVKKTLSDQIDINSFNVRNGEVHDCSGCVFKACLHFSEKGSCFYGGVMVEEAYPALKECDGLLLLCPNYNDALSANLTAFINRLTSLYRTTSFKEKVLYGVVVSGYSGGDIVARQLISALNMNKGFYLPGNFCIIETANDAGSLMVQEGMDKKASAFAEFIKTTI